MRRASVYSAAVLGVLLATAPSSIARGHRPAPRCPPTYERLLAADGSAVIYEAPEAERLPEIFACARGHRSYPLGYQLEEGSSGGGGIAHEIVSGAVVAYESSLWGNPPLGPGGSEFFVIVRDLRTGRILHKVPTGQSIGPHDIGRGPVDQIVAKGDGAVAWIKSFTETGPLKECPPECTAGRYQFEVTTSTIRAIDKSGSRILAMATDIDPGSLALVGSTLYWTQGGKPESASLS